MGSSEEEEVMEERKKEVKASPLALPRPSYSSIASKEVTKPANDEEQNPAESVISVPEQHKTLIVGDEQKILEQEVDEERFIPVLSKSGRRSGKSSRLSLSDKNESKEMGDIEELKSVQDSNREEIIKEVYQSKPSIREDWMIDDVGTIESSDEESEKKDFTNEKVVAMVDETKVVKEVSHQTSSKPSISEDWMIDDVGTIESSDEESDRSHVTSEDIAVKMDETKVVKEVSQPTSNKPSISEDWMIDDVGTMESSDDEEIPTNTDFEFKDVKSINELDKETKKPSISEDWMIDDVGTIESSDEEEVMEERKKEVKASPLPLPRPSYSSIASKEVTKEAHGEKQKLAESVITIHEQHKTLIVGD